MQGRPTSFDIAQLAGVSQPTVSRALRGSPAVSEATRRRVQAIAAEIGYTVDKNASSLRSQQSRTLALLMFEDPLPDHASINPFYPSILGAITRNCARRGYDLLVSFQQLSGDWGQTYLDSGRADGIILLGYGDYERYRARLKELANRGARFVCWGSVRAGHAGVTIGCDNVQGGREITEHLIRHGRRRLAFIGDISSDYPEFRERYQGHCDALAAAGLEVAPGLRVDAISSEVSGHDAALRLLAAGERFDAITCASDLMAIGAMRGLDEHGLRTPEDVAVTGFDDIVAASFSTPPLTTVVQDSAIAGERLVEALIQQINNIPTHSSTLPVRTIVRRSCGAEG
jgi:DNA-binding LacI/PurR family transcriptional regulator